MYSSLRNRTIRLDKFATICLNGKEFFLKTDSQPSEYVFISHAHSDHLCKPDSESIRAICSEETFILSTLRGVKMKRAESPFRLLDSGHILGSKAIVLEVGTGELLYTGDVNNYPLGSISRHRFPRVHTLIIESNYGLPNLVFPPRHELIREIADYVDEMITKNKPLVLMGYPLGKSQHLQMILDPFLQDVEKYASPSIVGYNEVYALFSMRIENKKVLSSQSQDLPKGRSWILYYPNVSGRNAFMQVLKKKYDAVLISFSGRVLFNGYEKMFGVDKAFPLSDHADFNGLLEIVKETSPQRVFTVHGFSKEFSRELKKLGYDSYNISSLKGKCIPIS
jgi:putative mRNA 3-end processing factor